MNSESPGRKVLLVDDEKMVLDVGKAILQRLGHDVYTAMSGQEGLDLLKAHQADIGCVVLDLTMPGMDGKETFKRMLEMVPDVRVIIASGLSADQIMGQFTESAPSAVIQKPYQIADLSDTIQSIMGRQS
ncbi:MAG: hypothetical protein CSA23_02185 [Deltaproteobacteria bacterium]|nr:MAG: hypothetical protein CSA23_02185 [Deltaproteobacteria bacterium]